MTGVQTCALPIYGSWQSGAFHDGSVSTDSKPCSGLKNLAYGNDRSATVVTLISVAHEFGAEVRLRLSERVIDLHVEVSKILAF